MNDFFAHYIDLTVLILGFIGTLLFTLRLARGTRFRRFPLFFVVYGAMLVSIAMVAHIFENSYHAAERVIAGTFVYDFRFYSRILMGVVFLAITLYMLRQLKIWGTGDRSGMVNFIKAALVLVVLSLPTAFLTPIGVVPTIACAISLASMPFAVKRRQPELVAA
ncbi:MAG: hypothetical protein ICV83_11130 [Cytophagales bacterium]|nr:hypothetical protein [Cytophagales bacterium]